MASLGPELHYQFERLFGPAIMSILQTSWFSPFVHCSSLTGTKGPQQNQHPSVSTTKMKQPKPIRRNIEAYVGKRLIQMAVKQGQKKAKLVGPKSVFLPKARVHMHFYEREPQGNQSQQSQPTLIFCHGIAQDAPSFGTLIADLNIPPHVRILCPEQLGQGEHLKQARKDPSYKIPNHKDLLESGSEFLDVVGAGPNCNVFGVSMGGAAAYYLRWRRPDIIQKAVLVSPAIGFCMDDHFVASILDRTNRFCDFESREDVKVLMRDQLSTGPYALATKSRTKKYPIPPFLYEAIYRQRKSECPPGYFTDMMRELLESAGIGRSKYDAVDGDVTNEEDDLTLAIRSKSDVDPDSPRLVLWPDQDKICNYDKAKLYFERSIVSSSGDDAAKKGTQLETIPNCGHVFGGDGRLIYGVMQLPRVREYLLDFS